MVSKFVPGPKIVVLAVIGGKADKRVIVPVALEKVIAPPPLVLASRIACLNEPAPESELFVTKKVAA